MPEIEHFFAPVSGYAYLGHEAMLRVIQPIAGNVEIVGAPRPNLDPNGHIVSYTVKATR